MLFRLFSEGSHKLNEALRSSTTSQHTHRTTAEKQVKQNLDFAALLWEKAQASVGRFLDEKDGGDTFQLATELGSWLQYTGCWKFACGVW